MKTILWRNAVITRLLRLSFISLLLIGVTACDSGNLAPVIDLNMMERVPQHGMHYVVRGETLYSIAWRYGLDYRYLASRNHIGSPYLIHVGQAIYLRGKVRSFPQENSLPGSYVANPKWIWPTNGNIHNTYSFLSKGINILGKRGQPIYAAASGKIVYCGRGIRGYGNLIIIKHNSLFLSAYAHNQVLLVKEGQWVKKGQKIAKMGDTGSNRVMLHFEIRKAGRPINPIALLAPRSLGI